MAVDRAALPAEAQKLLAKFPEFEPSNFNDSGANSYVLIGRHNVLKRDVALKIYFHAPHEVDQEPALIAALNHDHVMKVLDARNISPDCSFFMTPYANYGDLSGYLNEHHLSLPLALRLLRQLLAGLSSLHAEPLRLVHRDLKPQNLLVHDDKILIADFGSVRQIASGASSVPASKHSILYRPPEAFGDDGIFDFSSDCYQAGIIGYLLFSGRLSEQLTDHLKPAHVKQLAQLKSSNSSWADECLFIDQCVREAIERGTILDWSSVPPFVPRRIVRALRRATSRSKRFRDVSEFLAELAGVGVLPDWMKNGELSCTFRSWKGHDYKLIELNGNVTVKKRRCGSPKFITDHALSGGEMSEVFEQVSKKLGLP